MSKQRCTYIGSSHSFLLLGRLRLCTTSPSLLRNATSPNEGRPWQPISVNLFCQRLPYKGSWRAQARLRGCTKTASKNRFIVFASSACVPALSQMMTGASPRSASSSIRAGVQGRTGSRQRSSAAFHRPWNTRCGKSGHGTAGPAHPPAPPRCGQG